MNKTRKRLIIILSILFLAAIAGIAGWKYLPFRKWMHVSAPPEKDFVNLNLNANEAPDALFFDFEIDSTKGDSHDLYKGIAHSGKYSTKAFGKNTYSFSVDRKASEVCKGKLDMVSMSAWVYVLPGNNEPWGAFVFTANNSMGVNICWKGITVTGKNVPRGKWFKISGMFDLSDVKIEPDSKIQIYFWNNSSTDILIDDYYIVFGKQQPRKGDSTLTDMTRNPGFQPRFNTPPFPVTFLSKQDAGTIDPSWFDAKALTGHFLSSQGGREDIYLAGPASRMISVCSGLLSEIKVSIPAEVTPYLGSGEIYSGNFRGNGNSEILFCSNKGALMAGFEKKGDPCPGKGAVMKMLWKSPETDPFPGDRRIVLDADGDRISELLTIAGDGSWKLFRYSGGANGHWKESYSTQPVGYWKDKEKLAVIPGRFLQKYSRDLLLTIFREKGSREFKYTLLRYEGSSGQFVPCFSGKTGGLGKTIGLDTLKPSDIFFTGVFDKGGTQKVLRYNRDWRFDLKEIRFNDTTFQEISNIDFTGYFHDQNPKYYERPELIAGPFLDGGLSDMMIIARNKKPVPYLPDAVEIYSWRKEK